VLVTLAELGYPADDDTLLRSFGKVHGLPRLHASIEGNALWAMLTL
jgi:hypothetical protein